MLCVRDLIDVRPASADDHLAWLLDNEQFETALEFVKVRAI